MPRQLITHILKACIGAGMIIALGACQDHSPPPLSTEQRLAAPAQAAPEVPRVKPPTLESLRDLYSELDYSWHDLEAGVPPFILLQFPDDLDAAAQTQVKKHTFFMGLLPMVLLANQEISRDRELLLEILERYEHEAFLEMDDYDFIREMTDRYGLLGDPLHDQQVRTRLLKRVDIIPPALVLAQAANESAWGTSRFAREANNLFGQWTFTPGTGIVPQDRPPGAIYEVRKFSSLYESVRSYLKNLNTHGAYRELREIRAQLRRSGRTLTGRALVGGLGKYSAREEDYIAEIDELIRQNRLGRVNDVPLRGTATMIQFITERPAAGLFATRNRAWRRSSESWHHPGM